MPDIRNTIENTYNKLSIGDKAITKSLNTNNKSLDIKDTINNYTKLLAAPVDDLQNKQKQT